MLKALPAAAGAVRIRVAYLEATALQTVNIIKLCALQELHVFLADYHFDSLIFKNQVHVCCFVIQFQAILKA